MSMSAAPHTSIAAGLEDWSATVRSHFLELEVDADERFGPGRLTVSDGAHACAGMITASRHTVRRQRRHIASSPSGKAKIAVPLAGSCTLRRGDTAMSVPAGHAVLYDPDHPYDLTLPEDSRVLVLMAPKSTIGLPHGRVAGLAPSARSLVRSLAAGLSSVPTGPGDPAPDVTLPGVTAAVLASSAKGTDPRTALCGRVVDYIEQHLTRPDLTPDRIAAAHYVSRRTLYNAVARYDLSVSHWIRARRLQRCREDLVDRRYAHRSVRAVGAAWGFPDPAHFSHVFKAAYGISPVQWRRSGGP
ncbi:helix-turn-helix domain-containing protein [Rhodococcus sp. DMU1]|uniref:helix-turn-helix domain-containing protein n=1 Tax=Rhodococcus sp. DMU1 TaxID=2722825 RepID=UPI00143E2252|nr:helix-turn-helix domain-containing protein [Rhodococcus sp. DMU1]QIX49051.1 helix-turn-helix domain-containing protein [Rhodococcus sp. DMU1]